MYNQLQTSKTENKQGLNTIHDDILSTLLLMENNLNEYDNQFLKTKLIQASSAYLKLNSSYLHYRDFFVIIQSKLPGIQLNQPEQAIQLLQQLTQKENNRVLMDLRGKNEQLRGDDQIKQLKIMDLQHQLELKEQIITDNQIKLKHLSEQHQYQQEKAKNKRDSLKLASSTLQIQLQQFEDKDKAQQVTISQLQKQVGELQSSTAQFKSKISQQQQQIDKLTQELKSRQYQSDLSLSAQSLKISNLEKILSETSNNVSIQNNSIYKLECELQTLQAQKQHINNQFLSFKQLLSFNQNKIENQILKLLPLSASNSLPFSPEQLVFQSEIEVLWGVLIDQQFLLNTEEQKNYRSEITSLKEELILQEDKFKGRKRQLELKIMEMDTQMEMNGIVLEEILEMTKEMQDGRALLENRIQLKMDELNAKINKVEDKIKNAQKI
ncbi:Hypothetical_protein [Hexamita inflata]|uniref:Hypothetical_protein n=1 Tax=Hexamita inflata TaxID=28002 RepID=A0AA86NTL9_9EUKA|nr:Hypothetical protein HINF_LOCUS12921 [Hexamita inflata]